MENKTSSLLVVFVVMAALVFIVFYPAKAEQGQEAVAGNWEVVSSPTTSRLMGIDVVSENDVWAVGGAYYNNQYPIVLHYTGTDWTINSTADFKDQHLTSVSFANASSGRAVGYQMWSVFDGKWTHQKDFMTFLNSVTMLDANTGWAVGYRYEYSGRLNSFGSIKSYSGGRWQETSNRPDEAYTEISMLDADEGWIVGYSIDANVNGIVLHRTNTTQTWTLVNTIANGLYGVDVISQNEMWAVGKNGTILHYLNGGWESVSSPVNSALRDIEMLSATEGWIVGYDGTILYYANGAWQTISSPTQENLHDIDVLPSGEAWTVGDNGIILHYYPPAVITINHESGASGSYFTVTGINFPPNDTAKLSVNGTPLGTVTTNLDGALTFILSTENADEGTYFVTATVNPTATTSFTINSSEPIRPQEGNASVFEIPAGIALKETGFLPLVMRP